MKKLIIFGDSYVNFEWAVKETEQLGWPGILSSILNLPVVNYGISGTGLNYSMCKFLEYINSENYDSDDIIIWTLANEQRLHTPNMPNPNLGSFYKFNPRKIKTLPQADQTWFEYNAIHASWAMENYYDPAINYSLLKIAAFLKQWSKANKNNTVVLLRCQYLLKGGESIGKLIHHIAEHENFFPILNEHDCLSSISSKEFGEPNLHDYMLQKNPKAPGLDRRVNHLSYPNRIILARQLSRIINQKSISNWNRDEYEKSLYPDKTSIDNLNIRTSFY